MIATSRIRMDLVDRGATPLVCAVQDDKYSRNLTLELYDNRTAWNVPDGISVLCRYRKPDGTCGEYDTLPDGSCAWSKDGNTVTVGLAPQVLTVAGIVYFAVTLVSGERELSSFAVKIEVSALPGLNARSEDYFNRYQVLSASGWTPNKYLTTDAEGNIVTGDAPAGGGTGTGDGGASVEAVLAAIPQATGISASKSGNLITIETALDDGSSTTSVVTLDSGGYPVGIVTDGVECPVSWTGFDDAGLKVWEGGSY